MEPKLCLCLMLIIFGNLTVQGAIPRNNKKNPLKVFARQTFCELVPDPGICVPPKRPCPPDYYACPGNICPGFMLCCCPFLNSK